MPHDQKPMRSLERYRLIFWVAAVIGCRRQAAPTTATELQSPHPLSRPSATSTDRAAPPSVPDPPEGLRSPDGRPWTGAERVDADVVRVKTLRAAFVQANEIRCANIVRSRTAPVPMDLDPWLVSGDLVETDELSARSVVARLIIADEIRARIIRKVRIPHRWEGAGGPSPVRNRVTAIEELAAPVADPVFRSTLK